MLTISRLKDVINKENTSITEKISNVFLMIADSDVSFCNGELTCFNKDNYDNYRYSNWLIKINKMNRDFSTKKDCRITTVIFFCWEIYSTINR